MKYTIVRDKREKFPLPFPKYINVLHPNKLPHYKATLMHEIEVVDATIPVGDYGIWNGHNAYKIDTACVIERKAACSEIANNVLYPERRANFRAELAEMSTSFARGFLLFEGNLGAFYKEKDGPLIIDALQRLLLEYNVPMLFIPGGTPSARVKAADFVARLLINGANAK